MGTRSLITFLLSTLEIQVVFSQLPLLERGETQGSRCHLDCNENNFQPVCGSDLITYTSRCQLDKAKCDGHQVDFKHLGECTDKRRCLFLRDFAQNKSGEIGFVPVCNDDGSFAEIQCFGGYCWCVDSAGKQILSTSVKHDKPNCRRKGKKNTRRASQGKKLKKGCSAAERAIMNRNLIGIFRSEYNRFPKPNYDDIKDILFDSEEKQIIQWKFTELDINNDDYLKKNELRDLKRMSKKIVKPKSCARIFTKYCDLDEDKKISRTEWSVCLGIYLNISLRLFMSLNSDEQVENTDDRTTLKDLVRENGINQLKSVDETQDTSNDNEPQDCLTAQKLANDSYKQNPFSGAFVPDCTENGMYRLTQCHKSDSKSPDSLFCWCVNSRTGTPIPGTTSMDGKPDCDNARRNSKSFKGCSLQKKQIFLDEFVRFLVDEMRESKKNKSLRTSPLSIKEQAVKWKFDQLDVNNNQMIDRKEWGVFRLQWKPFQQGSQKRKKLKKCWRNLPKFCDDNGNSKVNPQEWLKCTGLAKVKLFDVFEKRRNGTNPFIDILKSDD